MAQREFRLNFQAKVLIPVIAVMVSLVGVTLWLVNHRITTSLEKDIAHKLVTADGVFKNSQSIRTKNLLLRYRNVSEQPRVKAVVQLPDPSQTVRLTLNELVDELGADAVAYTGDGEDQFVSAVRGDFRDAGSLEKAVQPVLRSALDGRPVARLVHVGTRLLDVVAVPVLVGERTIGSLGVASVMGETVAREFGQLTDCELVLFADGEALVSTLPVSELPVAFNSLYRPVQVGAISRTILGENHYLALAGRFATQNEEANLGYLLLSSYDAPLRALRETQRNLLLAGLLGIALGSTVIWFLIRNVTRPLRLLRDSAEAVGRGDYSKRVDVATRDECGDLAQVFNQMTTNVQASRMELEKTVETLKLTQEQLVQREKLSAIGEFVAGVTHELNNPLTSVLGYAELLKQSPLDETQLRDAHAIVVGAQRCQKIVQNLLSFARQHKPERKTANINELIQNVLEFMQYDLRTSNIAIAKRLDPQLPPARVDAHQIQQVFVNIIHNARQALEGFRSDGALIISTEAVGSTLRISFQDNGPGIAAENLSRIFDPFFTTKPVGKGTGLGMSLSYGIIKEHNGFISVTSKPGMGATFDIELPAVFADPILAAGVSDRRPAAAEQEGAGRRVLVIDDEPSVLELVSIVLKQAGYVVETAHDGEEALLRIQKQTYDLIISDLKMPGLNGRQVFERMRAFDANLARRFLFMTGDVMNLKGQEFFQQNGLACLPKPFSIAEFRAVVSRSIPT